MELATEKQMEKTIQLADRVNRISISPTMVVLQEAEKLKAQGIDVADFGPGEPDFPTPEHIKRAVDPGARGKSHEIHACGGHRSAARKQSAIGMPRSWDRLMSRRSASSTSEASTRFSMRFAR